MMCGLPLGVHTRTVDRKRRVVIPAELRAELGAARGSLVVVMAEPGGLLVLSCDAWRRLLLPVELPAEAVRVGGGGRILLPVALLQRGEVRAGMELEWWHAGPGLARLRRPVAQ